jgi:hypothetical protein
MSEHLSGLAGALALLALLALPSVAAADDPPPPAATAADDPPAPPAARPPARPAPVITEHHGGTFEMGLGLGLTRVSIDSGESKTFNGLSGLNLGFGGWVGPSTALTLRITEMSFIESVGGVDVRFIAGFIGLSVQHMAGQVWAGGGLGLGILTTDQDDIEPEIGYSLDLRGGVNLYQSAQSALSLSLELHPGWYDGLQVTGIGIQLGWQRL